MDQKKSPNVSLPNEQDERSDVYLRYEDDDDEMDIYDIITFCKKTLLVLKRYLALLLAFLVIGGVVGYAKTAALASESYTSTALLFVDLDRSSAANNGAIDASSTIRMLAASFSEIICSDSVLAPVAQEYSISRDNITVTVPDGTQTINVTVTCGDAAQVQEICDSVVNAGISAMDSATDYAAIHVVSPASAAQTVPGESAAKSAVSMAAIFLVIALLIVAVRELAVAYKAHEAASQAAAH